MPATYDSELRNYSVLAPDAARCAEQRRGSMIQGTWSQRGHWFASDRVCAMGALVPGARSVADCVSEGWPSWLVTSIVSLYDSHSDSRLSGDEGQRRADEWFRRLAELLTQPIDYEAAHLRYRITILEPVACFDRTGRIDSLIHLHHLAVAGNSPAIAAAEQAWTGSTREFIRGYLRRYAALGNSPNYGREMLLLSLRNSVQQPDQPASEPLRTDPGHDRNPSRHHASSLARPDRFPGAGLRGGALRRHARTRLQTGHRYARLVVSILLGTF